MGTHVVEPHERHHLEPVKAKARHTDPETSHLAAASVKEISQLQMHILQAFMLKKTLRDDELVYYLRDDPKGKKLAASPESIRSRRAELAKMRPAMVEHLTDLAGKVVKTEMPSGRSGQVWKLAEPKQ
jgi:hypothetical protein